VVEDEARARELTEYRERKRRESQATGGVGGASLADMMAKLTSKKISELPVVLKADVAARRRPSPARSRHGQ
jgi:translation initiation factor IF-2